MALYVYRLHYLVLHRKSVSYKQWEDVENSKYIQQSVGDATALNEYRIMGELLSRFPSLMFPNVHNKFPRNKILCQFSLAQEDEVIRKHFARKYPWMVAKLEPSFWTLRLMKVLTKGPCSRAERDLANEENELK